MDQQDASLIAYCGLDCSQCFGYTKTISEAAKGLRRVMSSKPVISSRSWNIIIRMSISRIQEKANRT